MHVLSCPHTALTHYNTLTHCNTQHGGQGGVGGRERGGDRGGQVGVQEVEPRPPSLAVDSKCEFDHFYSLGNAR